MYFKMALWPRLRLNILLNFTFESEATRANFHENKRNELLKWRPFWNKLYYYCEKYVLLVYSFKYSLCIGAVFFSFTLIVNINLKTVLLIVFLCRLMTNIV